MRKGIIMFKPPVATLELRAQASEVLISEGFTVEPRERFDGALGVAFELSDGKESKFNSKEELEARFRQRPLLAEVDFLLKDLS